MCVREALAARGSLSNALLTSLLEVSETTRRLSSPAEEYLRAHSPGPLRRVEERSLYASPPRDCAPLVPHVSHQMTPSCEMSLKPLYVSSRGIPQTPQDLKSGRKPVSFSVQSSE